MNRLRILFYLLLILLLSALSLSGQLTAPGSSAEDFTSYPNSPDNDLVFIFCTEPQSNVGVLRADTDMPGTKTYAWEFYNVSSGSYEPYHSETTAANFSEITALADGGYRVIITSDTGQETFRAWVFNFWRVVEGGISESNCDFFTLTTTFEQSSMLVYDPVSGTETEINADPQFEWREGQVLISRFPSPSIYDPPTSDTRYDLTVTDRFSCNISLSVTYYSIVTKASFTVDEMSGEAPLTVAFTNTSENGDPGGFEWFFFKDLDEIKRLSETTIGPIDSISFVAYDTNPVYTFENSGAYMVKLVSKKTSEFLTCTDTVYLETYIVADTSFIAAPNVFTPNGDGANDEFVVKFWSMKEVKISVFNRWGRTVHVFESKNVQGFQDTWAVSAWDGRIGGRYASPGVYYYVVEGLGRDGKKRWHKGFVHLFRDKD